MAKSKTAALAEPARPFRLEWVEAGSLADNPQNWRRHGDEQMRAIKDMLADPDVGWAGVLLYNERTKRLIDGHARKAAVSPDTLVPVIVGAWTPEAEAKILATLDPIGSMAAGDEAAFAALMDQFNADSLAVRDLLDGTMLVIRGQDDEDQPDTKTDVDGSIHPDMELRPFEHYDYVLVVARNTADWERLCELCGLTKVNATPILGKKKIGLGRVVDAARFVNSVEAGGSGAKR